ncbi:Ribosome-recycling factor [Thermoflexales bacterium]|jgi:ribosome recycling factor|nr:Ribosome-recycling factor [Thermoflexales bacterium]
MTTDPNLVKETLHDAEEHMKKTIHAFELDLRVYRTGRASPAIVEHLSVNYYDTPTPLQQLATISVPEAQVLMIRPFDVHSLKDIEKSISASDLGLTPNNDGKVIRLIFPRLSEERRNDLIKQVHKRLEEARVSIRNIRRDNQDMLRDFEKEKMISEDDLKRGREDLQKLTDKYVEQAESVSQRKEEEIREV